MVKFESSKIGDNSIQFEQKVWDASSVLLELRGNYPNRASPPPPMYDCKHATWKGKFTMQVVACDNLARSAIGNKKKKNSSCVLACYNKGCMLHTSVLLILFFIF